MKLYKDEDLCIGCKNAFFSKPYDHRDPTPGTIGYCIKCDNFLIKEKKMEFDRNRVYSAVNADELKQGDKVIVADTMAELKMYVEQNAGTLEIEKIEDDNCTSRFTTPNTNSWRVHFPLAYLVERKENCTNCEKFKTGYCVDGWDVDAQKIFRCENYTPKTEQKICLYCNHYSPDFCSKNHHVTKNYNKACADFDDLPVKKIDREIYDYYNEKKEIDMWNYTSEKLPEKQEMGTSDRVVVAIKGYNIVDIGYYDYELEAWFVDNNRYPVPVYAWMEVKPPREV